MKAVFLALPILIASCSIRAQQSQTDTDAVEYAKSIDVKTLDESLPSQRLEDWLRSGPPHVDLLQLSSEETCSNKPSGDEEYPRCVRVTVARGGQEGFFSVLIGTRHHGIVGPPKLYWPITIDEKGFVQTGGAERLSGLSDLLDQPAVVGGVDALYAVVIARHPRGIPAGADKDRLWPFLSARLKQQLQTARACQDDYAHHPPNAGGTMPGWLTSGLFSGDGKRAAPESVTVVKKERQKDGSFLLFANATERNDGNKRDSIVVAGGIRAYAVIPGQEWQIVTRVIQEGHRWVVDDVRIYDGSTETPSHLLSESFSGCDGPRWTGKDVHEKAPRVTTLPPAVDWDAVNVLRRTASKAEENFATTLNVHQLDATLPSMSLTRWLRSNFSGSARASWEGGKCNIKEGQTGAVPRPEGGLCSSIWFQQGSASVYLRVGRKPGAPPMLEYVSVRDKDGGLLEPFVEREEVPTDTDRLSDLHRLIREEAAIDVTRNLYAAVVDRHPPGVSNAALPVRINRLLTGRLRDQLTQARACQPDHLRQVQPLFSGEAKNGNPGAYFVESMERKGDGSFQVKVWFSRKSTDPSTSAASAPRWTHWFALATVRSEDGTFLVDDVRIFDGVSPDAPSNLLSDVVSKCGQ